MVELIFNFRVPPFSSLPMGKRKKKEKRYIQITIRLILLGNEHNFKHVYLFKKLGAQVVFCQVSQVRPSTHFTPDVAVQIGPL